MKKNVLLDDSVMNAMEKMDPQSGYEFIMGLLHYGIDGVEPSFEDKSLEIAFGFAKQKIDYNTSRYERCVENGKKGAEYGKMGAEYGKLGGRPRKESKDETPRPFVNCQMPTIERVEKAKEKLIEKARASVPVQEPPMAMPVQVAPAAPRNDLEMTLRSKLAEGENRKWITNYSDFGSALIQNKEFKDWVEDYDREEIERLWIKMRINYLKNLTSNLDVTDGINKEIYEWLRDKMIKSEIQGTFYLTCKNNQGYINDWMRDNGYDKNLVEIIFDKAWKEIKEMKEAKCSV